MNLQGLLSETEFYEHELERQIFMAVNVVRAAPAFFTDKIRDVRKSHPLAKTANNTPELIKHM